MSAAPTAASLCLLTCEVCRLVSRAPPPGSDAHCPRCGATLHSRKPASLARTWAFLITAMILYVPANVLPIMGTSSLFGTQRDTILSGVAFLWTSGSYVLALLVFAPISLLDAEGNPLVLDGNEVWLCRCGHSETKPFCDSSHRRVGFESVVLAGEQPSA